MQGSKMTDRDEELPQVTVLRERHNAAASNILGIKDRISYLTDEDANRLRGVVLRELAEFRDLAIELLRGSADGGFLNEVYVEMLRDIHTKVVGTSNGAA